MSKGHQEILRTYFLEPLRLIFYLCGFENPYQNYNILGYNGIIPYWIIPYWEYNPILGDGMGEGVGYLL